jgi:hypothetical protein
MLLTVFVVALVLLTVSKGFYTVAVLLVCDIHPLVFCSISQVYDGVPVHFVIEQLTITPYTIQSTMIVVVLSEPLHLVVAKLADVNVTVYVVELTFTVCVPVQNTSLVG